MKSVFFRRVAGHSPPGVTLQVKDVIASSRSYAALKEVVITRSDHTENQWIRRLFERLRLETRIPRSNYREGASQGRTVRRDPMMRFVASKARTAVISFDQCYP